jgi:hypothetical protein
MRFVDVQRVHQAQHVVDHLEPVLRRVMRLAALPVATEIERHDAVGLAQCVEEPAVDPGRTHAEDETVQQDDGFALASNHVVNVHAVRIEISRVLTHRLNVGGDFSQP